MNVIDRVFRNTPWWLISAGLHAVVLLGTALVVVERMVGIEVMACPVLVRPPDAPRSKLLDDSVYALAFFFFAAGSASSSFFFWSSSVQRS